MITKIDERVSVKLVSSTPQSLFWRGRVYLITQIGLHHTFWEGKILKHVFSVVSDSTAFKLILNTQTLNWKLEEVNSEEMGY